MAIGASITLKIKTVHTSETSVYSNETTRRYIQEDSHLHNRRYVLVPIPRAGMYKAFPVVVVVVVVVTFLLFFHPDVLTTNISRPFHRLAKAVTF
jgi:hypothetical protein